MVLNIFDEMRPGAFLSSMLYIFCKNKQDFEVLCSYTFP